MDMYYRSHNKRDFYSTARIWYPLYTQQLDPCQTDHHYTTAGIIVIVEQEPELLSRGVRVHRIATLFSASPIGFAAPAIHGNPRWASLDLQIKRFRCSGRQGSIFEEKTIPTDSYRTLECIRYPGWGVPHSRNPQLVIILKSFPGGIVTAVLRFRSDSAVGSCRWGVRKDEGIGWLTGSAYIHHHQSNHNKKYAENDTGCHFGLLLSSTTIIFAWFTLNFEQW